jgi:hypothetical protein
MDILDIYEGRYFKTHTGRYFERLPENITFMKSPEQLGMVSDGEDFDYEIVDPTTWRYKQLFNNVTDSEYGGLSIKSCDALPWRPKAYVATDDGRLYIITEVVEDTAAAQKEAARLMPIPIGTEYVMRLLEIENPTEV